MAKKTAEGGPPVGIARRMPVGKMSLEDFRKLAREGGEWAFPGRLSRDPALMYIGHGADWFKCGVRSIVRRDAPDRMTVLDVRPGVACAAPTGALSRQGFTYLDEDGRALGANARRAAPPAAGKPKAKPKPKGKPKPKPRPARARRRKAA